MNPRRPYRGPGSKPGRASSRSGFFGVLLALALLGGMLVWVARFRKTGFDLVAAIGSFLPTASPPAPPSAPSTTPTPPPPAFTPTDVPTWTPTAAPPTATPTALLIPRPTEVYHTQSGDTVTALAARFGVNPADIQAPDGLRGSTSLVSGQLLIIPSVLEGESSPGYKIVPDSEVAFSGGSGSFDPTQFAAGQDGYLAHYRGFLQNLMRPGGEVILMTAQDHSINPRLLTALLDYESGWVTNPNPEGDALTYPLGYVHPYLHDLSAQLNWAATQLAVGYYGWRAGTVTELKFPDGSTLRINPALNAGTVALQYFLAQSLNRPAWDQAVSDQGFAATYRRLLGDPFAHQLDPIIPPDLTQPPLALPFDPGHTWAFTGGPHGAWEQGGARAALDFAPGALESGCVESQEWVTAVAAGQIVRSGYGSVVLDLDGDGRESTGWDILYLHIADEGRVPAGTYVEPGDHIGHPSCEGGVATGTHVHIARKYNGEWVPADGPIPFNLGGWVAHGGEQEYQGTLTRGGQTVTACSCSAAWTAITADTP
jgi:LasA protease